MYRSLFADGHPDRLFFEQILKQCVGHSLQLRIFTGNAETGDSDSENQRLRLYKQAQRHPTVQALLETFGADIVAREPSAREEWLRQFKQHDENN